MGIIPTPKTKTNAIIFIIISYKKYIHPNTPNNNIIITTDTELANEVEKSIQQADGSAYMAIFVTTSSSSTPPSRYFKDARVEIERCSSALDELAAMIGL